MIKNRISLLIIIILLLLVVVILGMNYKKISIFKGVWRVVNSQLTFNDKNENKVEDQNQAGDYSIKYKDYLIEFSLPSDWISRLKLEPVNVGSTTDFVANDYSYVRTPNIELDSKKAVSIRDGAGWLNVQIFEVGEKFNYENLIIGLTDSVSNKLINPDLIEFKPIKKEKNIIGGYQGYVVEYNNKYYNDYIKKNIKDIDPIMDTWNVEQSIKLSDKDVLILSAWINIDQVENYKTYIEKAINNVKITKLQ